MDRRPVIRTVAEAEAMHARLLDGAARTATWLRDFNGEPMSLLRALRFDTVGHDPLTGEPLNVVEQLNQTFTILVTLRAIERLIGLHSEAGGFRLAPGHEQRPGHREHRPESGGGGGVFRHAPCKQPEDQEGTRAP